MIMLRSTPSSDSSSQRTLLAPYRSGGGTPEEEEELALLQRLEQRNQELPQPPQPPPSQPAAAAGPRLGHLSGKMSPPEPAHPWQSTADADAEAPGHGDQMRSPSAPSATASPPKLLPQDQAAPAGAGQQPWSPPQTPASGGEEASPITSPAVWFRQQAERAADARPQLWDHASQSPQSPAPHSPIQLAQATAVGNQDRGLPPSASAPAAAPASPPASVSQPAAPTNPATTRGGGQEMKAVDDAAVETPDTGNADGAPEGLEYALKFVTGTLVDALSNSAVAVFGGPGKHSYDPSPVRRAWKVDDKLPRMNRDAYNRLQDAAEMLAFSMAEVRNPKNRILMEIPAPVWRDTVTNEPMSKAEAARWLKDYQANTQKTGSGEYQVGVEVPGKDNKLSSKLVHGSVEFNIKRGTSDGTMSGKDMFDSMMKFYGPAVKQIEGNWVSGTNLEKVNALTQSGTPLESAVQMTWTGLQAARHGFTQAEIRYSGGEAGRYDDIQVIYRKPPGG